MSAAKDFKYYSSWKKNLCIFKEEVSASVLNDCDQILENFESNIIPFQQKTLTLRRQEANASCTLKELDTLLRCQSAATNHTSTIQAGIQSHNLEKFVETVSVCIDSKAYLEKYNTHNADVAHLSYLIETGIKSVEREFHSQLLKQANNFPFNLLFSFTDYVDVFRDSFYKQKVDKLDFPDTSKYAKTKLISDRNMQTMRLMADLLHTSEAASTDICHFYTEARCGAAISVLVKVKEAFSNNKNSTTPKTYTEKLISSTDVRGVSGLNPVSRGTSSNKFFHKSVRVNIGEEKAEIFSLEDKNDDYFYINRMFASMVVLTHMESTIMNSLILDVNQNSVTVAIIMAMLDKCETEVEKMLTTAKTEAAKNDILLYLSIVVSILPVIQFLVVYKPVMESIIKPSYIKPKRKLRAIMDMIENEVLSTLIKFRDIKENPGFIETKFDANIHEFTPNTLTSIFGLLDYSNIIGYVIKKTLNSKSNQKNPEFTDECWSHHTWKLMVSVMGGLKAFLNLKSATYPANVSRCLFLINNYAYIVMRLANHQTTCDSLKRDFIDVLVEEYNRLMRAEFDNFEQHWIQVLNCLNDERDSTISKSIAEFQYSGKSLSSKHKSQLKNAFKTFNSELTSLTSLINGLIPPPKLVQLELVRRVTELVVPVYQNFIRTYGDIPFTTKMTKYIKYTSDSLILTIQEMFVRHAGLEAQASLATQRSQLSLHRRTFSGSSKDARDRHHY